MQIPGGRGERNPTVRGGEKRSSRTAQGGELKREGVSSFCARTQERSHLSFVEKVPRAQRERKFVERWPRGKNPPEGAAGGEKKEKKRKGREKIEIILSSVVRICKGEWGGKEGNLSPFTASLPKKEKRTLFSLAAFVSKKKERLAPPRLELKKEGRPRRGRR